MPIPQSQAKTEQLLVVTDPGKTILAPMVGTGSGLVVGQVVPRISILAVVLTNRAPLSFAKVGPPFSPVNTFRVRLTKPCSLCVRWIPIHWIHSRTSSTDFAPSRFFR